MIELKQDPEEQVFCLTGEVCGERLVIIERHSKPGENNPAFWAGFPDVLPLGTGATREEALADARKRMRELRDSLNLQVGKLTQLLRETGTVSVEGAVRCIR